MALRTGGDIFGPLVAGFEDGEICDGGECESGVDIASCAAHLEATCQGELSPKVLVDACGGRESPYRFHKGMECLYDASDWSSHSVPPPTTRSELFRPFQE